MITNRVPLPLFFYKHPYNRLRRAKIIVFGNVLDEYEQFRLLTDKKRFSKLKKLESACFNYAIDRAFEENIPTSWSIPLFGELYSSICYKVSSNIDKNDLVNSSFLADRIINNLIDIKQVPRLPSYELCPHKYADLLRQIEESKNVQFSIKTTSMYKCGKCKKSECTYENLYNRSLDEGVNIKVTCINCGNSFIA